jgi:hypothetical protein
MVVVDPGIPSVRQETSALQLEVGMLGFLVGSHCLPLKLLAFGERRPARSQK